MSVGLWKITSMSAAIVAAALIHDLRLFLGIVLVVWSHALWRVDDG